MNRVILMGRLTRDPDVRYSQGEGTISNARYTLAVDRNVSRNSGDDQPTADFISCVAFGRTAEFVEKYLKKGTKIAIEGRIQTGSYTNKDGQRVYTTDVIVDRHEFCESRGASSEGSGSAYEAPAAGGADPGSDFMNIPEGIDEALPFK
ncbi:MAG: single-stranded DNA-binding protein [Lachnospiraceae bacterium]|nr:single-stranded DNA-binding protein [Lachnospiraceae bacterium]MCR4595962.1 single-stranded DNA-binding protein [Lachnospiraceae bacterium]